MIKLTKSEKASRYDALQAAIKQTMRNYQSRREEAEARFASRAEVGVIGAYSKGQADAYGQMIGDLARWAE